MVLLYNDIDDSEIENMDDPEEEQEVYRVKSSINCFNEILSSGNLKKFDSLVNILMGTNDDKKDKIKLMIDIAPNFKNYISLIDDIIKNGKLNYRKKYALIELLKKMQENRHLNLPISYILFYHLHNTQKNQLLLVDLNLMSHWCDDFTLWSYKG